MKSIKILGIALFLFGIVTSCEETGNEIAPDTAVLPDVEGKSHGSKSVSVPFKAKFYTERKYDESGEGFCSEDPYFGFNKQVGKGNATHLGKFTTVMRFCQSGFNYKNGEGIFVAANGDELYFHVPAPDEVGEVVLYPSPSPNPPYEAYFMDPFSFNGGTGRFEGATGGGYTDSFVNLFDDDGNFILEHRTDHKWTGTLILPKDKKGKKGKKGKKHKRPKSSRR